MRALTGRRRLGRGAAVGLAWFGLALAVVSTAAGQYLLQLLPNDVWAGGAAVRPPLLQSLSLLAYAAVGALIAARHPDNAVGWLFWGTGLSRGVWESPWGMPATPPSWRRC